MGTIRALTMTVAALALATGCAPAKQTLVLHSGLHANHDCRFYVVVRALKEQEFAADGYQRIAALVYPTTPDPSVKLLRLVSPGHDEKLVVTVAPGQAIGVYALLLDPGDAWKALVLPPLDERYDLVVDGNQLQLRPPKRPRKPAAAPVTADAVDGAPPVAPSLPSAASSSPSPSFDPSSLTSVGP